MTDNLPNSTSAPFISGMPFADAGQFAEFTGPKPTVLIVLDGWGLGPENAGNAIRLARTPNLDKYWASFPHAKIQASGQAVGLPAGEDGNTETGHMNIGAGTIVYQDLPRINAAIADGSFAQVAAFHRAFDHVRRHNSKLHLMGLIGSGGVHSNIEHLYALLNLCKQEKIPQVYIHAFTDGRDSPPTSGITYIRQIGEFSTIMGRLFSMDRDKKWDRIEKAYHAMVIGSGICTQDPIGSLQEQYDRGITDEFIEPMNICDPDGSHRAIADNDAVLFFNYRVDRPRELTRAFVLPDFEQGSHQESFDPYQEKYEKTNIMKAYAGDTFQRQKIIKNLYFVTMTRYEDELPVDVAMPPLVITNPICKVFSSHGLRQLRITETEKERFVTYYMNGLQEAIYPGEDRVIIPSKGVRSYDQAPEMKSREIGEEMINRIQEDKYDVIIANICNADMVGHTGNLQAAITACEIVDEVVGKIVDAVLPKGGIVMITADHGNAEEMINNDTGEIDTEHSTYPVPLWVVSSRFVGQSHELQPGILADIAPTMLHLMGIPKPDTMTGRALL